MLRVFKRMAGLLAEGAGDTEDVSRSLNSLVKHNQGRWKSAKQANYLFKSLKAYQTPEAKRWAHTYNPQGHWVAVELLQKLKGYGHYNKAKIRYYATVFLVDETGVAARAKLKVIHPKGEDHSPKVNYSGAKETFKRPEEASGKVIDVGAQEAAKSAQKAEQLTKNKPLIDRIRNHGGWEHKTLLKSFLDQLEKGYKLSPKQQAVLDSMIPPEASVQDKAEAKAKWDALTHHFKTQWAPVFDEIYKSHGLTGSGYDARKSLDKMLAGEHSGGWAFDNWFGRVLEKKRMFHHVSRFLGTDNVMGSYLASFALRLEKYMKQKPGKKVPKVTSRAMSGIAYMHDKLMSVDAAQLRKILKDEFGDGKPEKDPFAEFEHVVNPYSGWKL